MKKEYLITLGVSFLVTVSVFVILLMLMLPQQVQLLEGNINKYDSISKSKYTFESTKDISTDTLVKKYAVTSEDMDTFLRNRQYKPGNSDPFTPIGTDDSSSSTSGASGSGGTTSGGGTSNSDTEVQTKEKITNSNGGVENPPSVNK